MIIKHRSPKVALASLAILGSLGMAACGTDSTTAAGPTSAAAPTTSASSAAAPTSSAASPSSSASSSATDTSEPFGAACADVPTSGKGSFDGMSQDPVATAASNNPALSTLVTAVGKAKLGDTLNNADGITVFAPDNDAFKALPSKTLNAALADPSGLLTNVLTMHVVKGRLSPDQLAGTHQTLNPKQKITVTGSGTDFTVDGNAKVVCGNVQTANATVYIIDHVLLPKS